MKILFTIFGLTPAPKSELGVSGSDIRFINIFKNFPKNSYRLHLLGTDSWAAKLSQHNIDFTFHRTNSFFKFSNKLTLVFTSFSIILKTLLTQKIPSNSVIYSTSDLFWETIPAYWYRPSAKLWIQLIHHLYPHWRHRPGNFLYNFFGYYFQKFSLILIKHKADAILVYNSSIKDKLISLKFDPAKIHLCTNGIDPPLSRRQEQFNYDAVFLGRLDPSKGLNDFIPIWSEVCQSIPQAKLALIGGISPQQLSVFNRSIKDNDLSANISVLGFLDKSQVADTLSTSKIFIFPSHEEGWGIAIAEAMSYGLPIVCWDLENLHYVYNNNLIYSKPFDHHDFSQKIISLLNSPDYMNQISTQNLNYSSRFSWQKTAQTEFNLIRLLVKSKIS